MNILVTGAAGFIGYHCIKQLLEDGHSVLGIDNFDKQYNPTLKWARLRQLGIAHVNVSHNRICQSESNPRLSFLQLDIREREKLLSLAQQQDFDAVLHLASLSGAGYSLAQPAAFVDCNIVGTQNVLDAARATKAKHFIFTSSHMVHGDKARPPFNEEDDVNCPLHIYGTSKRAAELLCSTYAKCYGLPTTVLRLFTVYGPWSRPDSTPVQLAKDIMDERPITLYNLGHQTRDFTYIDDVVVGIMAALSSPPFGANGMPYSLYNLGRSQAVPLMAFVQALEHSLGKTATIELEEKSAPGEPKEVYADTSKFETELAYSAVWDYQEGVPPFVAWIKSYRSNQEL